MRHEAVCERCRKSFSATRARTQPPPRFCSKECYIGGDELERFWRRVDRSDPDGCWPWLGGVNVWGYGQTWDSEKQLTQRAHRWIYEQLVGPIPEGMDLDHACHDPKTCRLDKKCPHRRCVRPDHLRPMSHKENCSRNLVTHCHKGHEYDEEYRAKGYGCRTCAIERAAAQRERAKRR